MGLYLFLVLHLNFSTLFDLLNDCVSDGEGEACVFQKSDDGYALLMYTRYNR